MTSDPECSECHHFHSSHQRASEGGCQCGGCSCRRFHGAMEKALKMSTAQFRDRLVPLDGHPMCWEASLAVFGVTVPHDEASRSTAWIIQQLEDGGRGTERVELCRLVPDAMDVPAKLTLATVLPHVQTGSWLLFTDGHVLAVSDGQITDTAGTNQTVKRRVKYTYRVKNDGPKEPVKCECLEPLVFGHAPGHRWARGMQL